MEKGQAVDPYYLSDLSTRSIEMNKPINFAWDEEGAKAFAEKHGAKQLEAARQLFDQSSELFKEARMTYYTPQLFSSEALKEKGFKGFAKATEPMKEDPEWEWDGNLIPKRRATRQQVAEQSKEYFAYDENGELVQKKLDDKQDYDQVVGGWDIFGGKSLTISSNQDAAKFYPEVAAAIKEGRLNPNAPFKDEEGLYRYREVKEGERAAMGVRSWLGPREMYNESWGTETLQTLNDVAMKALDGAVFLGYFADKYAGLPTVPGAEINRHKADRWQQDYSTWSARRKSAGSLEEDMGWDYSWSNKSKMIVDGLAQLAITTATGGAGSLISAGTGRAAAYGFNTAFAMNAAREEALQHGLGTESADLMAVFAGGILVATEKLGGEQFIPKLMGKGNVSEFTKKITGEVIEHANKLGIEPSDLLKNKKLRDNVVLTTISKAHQWLSAAPSNRGTAALKGYLGEGIQEMSEDAGNALAQEGYDLASGKDNYKNSWEGTLNNLRISGTVGGITGGIAGGTFFRKKAYEANKLEEDRLHYLTHAVLSGQEGALYKAMENAKALQVIDDNTYNAYKQQVGYVKKISKQYGGIFPNQQALGEFIDRLGVPGDATTLQQLGKDMQQFIQQEGITAQIRKDMVKQDILLSKAKQVNPGLFDGVKHVYGVPGEPHQVQMEDGTVREITASEKGILAGVEGDWATTDYGKLFEGVKQLTALQRRLDELNYFEEKGLVNEKRLAEKEETEGEIKSLQGDIQQQQEKLGISEDMRPMFEEYARMDWVQESIEDETILGEYMERATLEAIKKQHPEWFEQQEFNVRSWKDMDLRRQFFAETEQLEMEAEARAIEDNSKRLQEVMQVGALEDLIEALKNPMQTDTDTWTSLQQYVADTEAAGPGQEAAEVGAAADKLLNMVRAANHLKGLDEQTRAGIVQTQGIEDVVSANDLDKGDMSLQEKIAAINPEELEEAIAFLKESGILVQDEHTGIQSGDSVNVFDEEGNQLNTEPVAAGELSEEGIAVGEWGTLPLERVQLAEEYKPYFPELDNAQVALDRLGNRNDEALATQGLLDQAKTLLPNVSDEPARNAGDAELFADWVRNRNITNGERRGQSVIDATNELAEEVEDGFDDVERVNSLIRETKENLLNLRLTTAMGNSPLEEEAAAIIHGQLLHALNTLLKIQEVAQANKNQRGKRDYQMKSDFINLRTNFLQEFNEAFGLSVSLEGIPVLFSGEVNDEIKASVDQSYALLLEAENQMHAQLRELLSPDAEKPFPLAKALAALGIRKSTLYNADKTKIDGLFKQLHSSMERPYGRQESTSDVLEMKAWYLVSLQRSNPQEFHDILAEYMSEIKPEEVLLPSFEQVAILRQVMSNLRAEQGHDKISRLFDAWTGSGISLMKSAIFVRGIAGAGKSSMILRMAIRLLTKQRMKEGQETSVWYSAPIAEQVANAGKALNFEEAGYTNKGVEFKEIMGMIAEDRMHEMDEANVLVVDEASVFGNEMLPFMQGIAEYNKTREDNPLQLMLLGDELQKAEPVFKGKISLYSKTMMPFFIERTVPLVTPYRTGKVDSGKLQNNHRRVLIELNKIYLASEHEGAYKGPWMQEKEAVNDSNIDRLIKEVVAHFDRPFTVRYMEEDGALSKGVQAFSDPSQLYLAFARAANKWQSEKSIRFITEDRNAAIKGIREAFRALGLPEPADLQGMVKTSQKMQGLDAQQVFTDTDAAAFLEGRTLQHTSDIMELYQSQYVGESREIEALAFVGKHPAEKVSKESQIAAYPPVRLDLKDKNDILTESSLALQEENARIAEHYKSLGSLQEEAAREEEGSEESQDEGSEAETDEEVNFNQNPMYNKKKSEMTAEELEAFNEMRAENKRGNDEFLSKMTPEDIEKSLEKTDEDDLAILLKGCKVN